MNFGIELSKDLRVGFANIKYGNLGIGKVKQLKINVLESS